MINVWDILSTVGDIMMHVGVYHQCRGGCSVPWRDTILCDLSTVWGIMIHVGDIMSTVGGVQYPGVLK